MNSPTLEALLASTHGSLFQSARHLQGEDRERFVLVALLALINGCSVADAQANGGKPDTELSEILTRSRSLVADLQRGREYFGTTTGRPLFD